MSDELCPTCGGPVTVAVDGLTHRYQPAVFSVIDVTRLDVRPGEVLAVRLPSNTPRVEVEKVRAWFREHLPGVILLITGEGVSFAVFSDAAAQKSNESAA